MLHYWMFVILAFWRQSMHNAVFQAASVKEDGALLIMGQKAIAAEPVVCVSTY